MGVEAFAAFGILIALVFVVSGLQRFIIASPQVAAVVSAVLVELANGDRASGGFGILKINPRLVAAAQAKANDMAAKGYFAHTSPEGVDPWHWFKEAGYTFDHAGENLAVDFSDSGDVERAWMESPTHRENILNPRFTEVGIATAQGTYQGRPTTFVVQEFGTPTQSRVAGAPVQTETIPENPTEPAIATTHVRSANISTSSLAARSQKPSVAEVQVTQVLGSTAKEPQKVPDVSVPSAEPNPESKDTSHETPLTSPALAAALAQEMSGQVPLWAYPVSFPRDTLRYTYYAIGILVLLALAIETGFEIRFHHRRRAARAGLLLIAMCVLFLAASYFFFSEPVLAAISG